MEHSELIGYLASAFVAVSLLMSNMRWLRYINSIGCILFVIYGIWIQAYPVAYMNTFCLLINIYYLIKMKKSGK